MNDGDNSREMLGEWESPLPRKKKGRRALKSANNERGAVNYEPVPTEYKGVLYRSKCEAMFARYLELEIEEGESIGEYQRKCDAGKNCRAFGEYKGGFYYEPTGWCVDGWKPDFLKWTVCSIVVGHVVIPHIRFTVIEYKPSKPTMAYCEMFFKRFRKLESMMDIVYFGRSASLISGEIYFGSVFNACRGVVYESKNGVTVGGEDWLSNFEEKIKATRFDLVQR